MRRTTWPLALHAFGADDRAGGRGDLTGAVLAVIVVDVYVGRRQRRAEAGDGLADRRFLIVARQQHGDAGAQRTRAHRLLLEPRFHVRHHLNPFSLSLSEACPLPWNGLKEEGQSFDKLGTSAVGGSLSR
jgi:hypothetical protein